GNSAVQRELLKVVSSVALKGSEFSDEFGENKLFNALFEGRGISPKIEVICGNIFLSYFNNLVKFLKETKKKKESNEIFTNEQQIEFENRFIQSISTIKAFGCMSEHWFNRDQYVEKYAMHKQIIPLIHINCKVSLNCSNRIELRETETIHEFQDVVLYALGELAINDQALEYLMEQQNVIIEHIAPIINSFSTKSIITSTSLKIENQIPSRNVVIGAIHLLQPLLKDNPTLCKQVQYYPGLGTSIVSLTNFIGMKTDKQRNCSKSAQIRKWSSQCIEWMRKYDKSILLTMISEWNYLAVNITSVACAGGNEIEDPQIIEEGLRSILEIYECLRNGNKEYSEQPSMLREVQIEVEEEGAIEDIEANLYHSTVMDDQVQWLTEKCLNKMINQEIY
ncbi:MAG: hypothetical protein EZS28_030963, partial [Streblomastix strix]